MHPAGLMSCSREEGTLHHLQCKRRGSHGVADSPLRSNTAVLDVRVAPAIVDIVNITVSIL